MYVKVYLEFEKLLNELFKKADYCSKSCPRFNYNENKGCCDKDYYKTKGKIKQEEWDNFEVLRNKEKFPIAKKDECDYHTSTGCSLTNFKNPICLAYICPEYSNYLINLTLKKDPWENVPIYNSNETFDFLESIINNTVTKDEISNFKKKINTLIDLIN